MKQILFRIINTILLISSEVFLFFPSRVLLNVFQLISNLLYTLGRYLVLCNQPEDGNYIVSAMPQLKYYLIDYFFLVLQVFGIYIDRQLDTNEECIPDSNPVFPIDY